MLLTKSSTSASLKLLSSDNIGTRCLISPGFPEGSAPILSARLVLLEHRKLLLEIEIPTPNPVVFRIGNRWQIILVIGLVVRGESHAEPRMLGSGHSFIGRGVAPRGRKRQFLRHGSISCRQDDDHIVVRNPRPSCGTNRICLLFWHTTNFFMTGVHICVTISNLS